MTVSNVINGKDRTVGRETASRVRVELERLNYRPHSAARSLRQAKTYSVGMLIVNDDPAFLAAPFTTHLVAGLSNHLSENGYCLAIQGIQPGRTNLSNLYPHVALDGICAYLAGAPENRAELQSCLREFRLPIVLFQDRFLVAAQDCCVIRQDDRQGGHMLADMLLQRGARKLLMLTPLLEWPALAEREQGVREAIAESPQASLVVARTGNEDFDHIFRLLDAMFGNADRPDAVLASNDQLAIATLMYAKKCGIEVPSRLQITGFNGFEFWKYTEPRVNSIRSAAYELGVRGGVELLRRLNDGTFAAREIVLPISYLEGNTIGSRATANSVG